MQTSPTIGDVVFLNGGGPPMTITELNSTGDASKVAVVWMNGLGLESQVIPFAALATSDQTPVVQAAIANTAALIASSSGLSQTMVGVTKAGS